MDSTNDKASDFERRVSTRRNSFRNSALLSGYAGVGEDDFDAAPTGMISDGFRPAPATFQAPPSSTRQAQDIAIGPAPMAVACSKKAALPAAAAADGSNTFRSHDSHALQNDGGMEHIREESPSLSFSSLGDSTPMVCAEMPFHGPCGPSHPYQMYPQTLRIARTMSVATSSTVPSSEYSYAGPRGPSHPYALYQQAILPGTNIGNTVPTIPLGFNRSDQYQRRIGPDGEEIADMIGPDGHTEQLPPYTRYPDEALARKVQDVERAEGGFGARVTTSIATTATGAATVAAIPGAGGVGLATRNPEFDSIDDLEFPRSRDSIRSFRSDAGQHKVKIAAVTLSQKGPPLKPWHIWMRRKAWGIVPYWAVSLTGVMLLLMAIILASVIGAFLSRKPKKPSSNYFPTPNPTDAIPISVVPTILPSLWTGTYAMPLLTNEQSSSCLNDTVHSQVWNCNIIVAGMDITIDASQDGNYSAAIQTNQSMTISNYVYLYGEQPPVTPNPESLILVNDTSSPSLGPAWFHTLRYDKTMVLPEGLLAPAESKAKRKANSENLVKRSDRSASWGDKFWVCTWPDTILEVFIYPQANSSFAGSSSLTESSASPSSAVAAILHEKVNVVVPPQGYSGTFDASRSATSTSSAYAVTVTSDEWDPHLLVPYPKVVKLEERRTRGMPSPMCRQLEIVAEGQPAVPVKDANGDEVVITIAEDEGYLTSGDGLRSGPQKRGASEEQTQKYDLLRERSAGMSSCGCVWTLT